MIYDENEKGFEKYIESLDISVIEDIATTGGRIPPLLAKKASIICRRRFRPDEVLATVSLDEGKEGEAGLVVTGKGLFAWTAEDTFRFGLDFQNIIGTDYNGAGVKIITKPADERPTIDTTPLPKGIGTFLNNIISQGDEHMLYFETDDEDYDDEDEDGYLDYYRELYAFITDIVTYAHERGE